ncbi:MAG: hypothetical protein QOJ65_1780 [Fimbriimonadaceae bacterium]|jgi:hypothetical protein|nr:hypothetical protein [Fimbriimonadaceae bacterium]
MTVAELIEALKGYDQTLIVHTVSTDYGCTFPAESIYQSTDEGTDTLVID